MSPVDSGDDDDLLNSSRLSYPALWLYSPYVSVLLCRSPPVYPPVPVSQPRDPHLANYSQFIVILHSLAFYTCDPICFVSVLCT